MSGLQVGSICCAGKNVIDRFCNVAGVIGADTLARIELQGLPVAGHKLGLGRNLPVNYL